MGHPLEWHRPEPGTWHLYDKPGETPRQRLSRSPVAWITGLASVGYHGGLGPGRDATFHARTIPALKAQIETFLSLKQV